MNRVIVIGSSNIDLTARVDTLPKEGETVLGGDLKTFFGGKGANQAVAAKKGGADVLFITKLGGDAFGQKYKKNLLSLGIRPKGILSDKKSPTGTAMIAINKKGGNLIVVSPGANSRLFPRDIDRLKKSFSKQSVMLLQLEIPPETVEHSLKIGKLLDMITILNPAPAKKLSGKLLKNVDIITPNETELEILTGIKPENRKKAVEASISLIKKGVRNVVVTMGEKGALLVNKDGAKHFPAFKVKAVDTTAAGDAFNGVLACSLANGLDLEIAILRASVAGALSVTKPGAQPSLPGKRTIEGFLKS
jgi:ribokinase